LPEDPARIAAAELPDVYAGSWWEREGELVLAFTRDAVLYGEALRRRTGASFSLRTARFTAAALDGVMTRIEADGDLLDAEGVLLLEAYVDVRTNRVRMELVTAAPAETLAWLYERYGPALRADVLGPSAVEEQLVHATGYRPAEGGIELRYARGGELVRVEVSEHDDAISAGIVESQTMGAHTADYREAWARAELSAPLGDRRVRDAVSGRWLPEAGA